MSYIKWRVYVGPPFSRTTSTVHWDWSAIDADASYTPTSVATTLSSTLASGAGTASVSSTSAFPSKGGFWVGSSRWTYVQYTGKTATTFTGLTWSSDTEENTTHASGSAVKLWYGVDANDGRLQFDWQMDDTWSTRQWTAQIGGGVTVPQSAIRNNHFCLVQTATTATGTWYNFCAGWLYSPEISEPEAYRQQWTAKIVSSPYKIAEIEGSGLRVGDMNIAVDSTASAISSLAMAYKERFNGEYVAAAPDFSPASAIDDDAVTLWISEDVIGSVEDTNATGTDPAVDEGLLIISQMHINPAVGEPNGYRWIEITSQGELPYDVVMWTDNEDYLALNISGSYASGDKIIICEDDVLFEQQNPRSSAALVFSLEDIDSTWFDNLDPAGGGLGIYFTTQFNEGWTHSIVWGTGGRPDRGASNPTNRYGYDYASNGGRVTAPAAGETMRYTFSNNATAKNNWTTDFLDHAGYNIMTGDAYDEPWFLVDIPPMGLVLAEDISAGYTGTVTIKDDSGDTTGGLPSSGSIQIGDDICTFNSKTDTTINLTSAPSSDHLTGDTVYVVISGVATDAMPITKIYWDSGNVAYANFKVYYTSLINARTPGASNYIADYTLLANVTGHSNTEYTLDHATVRGRKVLILPTLMADNPSRMRMRNLEIYLDRTYYDTDTWLAEGTAVADVFDALCDAAYIPTGATTITDDTNHDLTDLMTDTGKIWAIMADLADYSGYLVYDERDSKLTIEPNAKRTASSLSSFVTWGRTTSRAPRMVQDGGGLGAISQLKIEWKTPDETDGGTVSYPSTADWRGSVIETGPYYYLSESAAQVAVERIYWMTRYPYTYYLEPLTPNSSLEPGQVHRLQWDWDASRAQIDRYTIVTGVSHEFNGNRWSQSLTLRQVERSLPN